MLRSFFSLDIFILLFTSECNPIVSWKLWACMCVKKTEWRREKLLVQMLIQLLILLRNGVEKNWFMYAELYFKKYVPFSSSDPRWLCLWIYKLIKYISINMWYQKAECVPGTKMPIFPLKNIFLTNNISYSIVGLFSQLWW